MSAFVIVIFLLSISSGGSSNDRPVKKCCAIGYLINEGLACESVGNDTDMNIFRILGDDNSTLVTCFQNGEGGEDCVDVLSNGSLVNLTCYKNTTSESKPAQGCDNILTPLKFWGATIVIFANIIYIIPYFIVVLVYCLMPHLRNRAYDRAVVSFNVAQFISNLVMISTGSMLLCHKDVKPIIYVATGLALMFFTISSTLWSLLICFDMTLVITRLRWVPPSSNVKEQENRKFLVYSAFVWGIAFVPTALAMIVESTDLVPESSFLRPNFRRFHEGTSLTLLVYVVGVPVLVFITSNVLFAYTSYRMIVIKKSTAAATQSSTKKATQQYSLYLRLYLLMDSHWLTGALGAIFPDLWILKFFRMIQPIAMLLAMLPKHTLRAIFCCEKNPTAQDERPQQPTPPKDCSNVKQTTDKNVC